MARSGIYKSEVQKARDTLLAQGKNPSIDAVRAALGNTGSKTTIHRYLKELDEEENNKAGRSVAVSEAIQDLVGRLAERLQAEADERINQAAAEFALQLMQHDEVVGSLNNKINDLSHRLQQSESALSNEKATLAHAQQALQDSQILNAQLSQQVADGKERLAENEQHRQSLEDKHQHAREALEHYRNAMKEQREQEQRRHEQQVQLLQAELRTLNQTLIVKQNELTSTYQDAARTGAELLATRKALHRSEQDVEKADKTNGELQQRIAKLEDSHAALLAHVQQANASRDELWQRWEEKQAQDAAAQQALAASMVAPTNGGEDMAEPDAQPDKNSQG